MGHAGHEPRFYVVRRLGFQLCQLQVFLDFHPAGRLPFQYPNPAERHEQNEEDSRACNEQIPDERAVVRFSPQVDPFRVDGQPFFLGYGGQGLVQDGDQLGPVLSYGEMEGELLFRLEGHELEVGEPRGFNEEMGGGQISYKGGFRAVGHRGEGRLHRIVEAEVDGRVADEVAVVGTVPLDGHGLPVQVLYVVDVRLGGSRDDDSLEVVVRPGEEEIALPLRSLGYGGKHVQIPFQGLRVGLRPGESFRRLEPDTELPFHDPDILRGDSLVAAV